MPTANSAGWLGPSGVKDYGPREGVSDQAQTSEARTHPQSCDAGEVGNESWRKWWRGSPLPAPRNTGTQDGLCQAGLHPALPCGRHLHIQTPRQQVFLWQINNLSPNARRNRRLPAGNHSPTQARGESFVNGWDRKQGSFGKKVFPQGIYRPRCHLLE